MSKKEDLIVQLETSAEICSAAISVCGVTLDHITLTEPYVHSKSLSVIIDELLKRNAYDYSDISAVAVSAGPGSYTGLRVGFATAKGLCFALNCSLISISTLDILAHTIKNQLTDDVDLILPVIDARRMEVYTAHYDNDVQCTKEHYAWIVDNASLEELGRGINKICIGGNATEKISGLLSDINPGKWQFMSMHCSASDMSGLSWQRFQSGKFDSVAYTEPEYLKPPNITTPKTLL